ncbi:MAG: TPM domain-containing protein [Bacteroidales bacterium]|nr:TPM domain-containing protein [Bacteroidales bacterium]
MSLFKSELFFDENQKSEILEAIKTAECNTSGEIRVHIEENCKEDVLDRAAYIFKKLEIHKTELRNGVLFYLAVKDRKFAILGDSGINSCVPENFWDDIKTVMLNRFKEGAFSKGLTEGILMAGVQLKAHFQYSNSDINELSDDISFG